MKIKKLRRVNNYKSSRILNQQSSNLCSKETPLYAQTYLLMMHEEL